MKKEKGPALAGGARDKAKIERAFPEVTASLMRKREDYWMKGGSWRGWDRKGFFAKIEARRRRRRPLSWEIERERASYLGNILRKI